MVSFMGLYIYIYIYSAELQVITNYVHVAESILGISKYISAG
jgi:hypothetical protein